MDVQEIVNKLKIKKLRGRPKNPLRFTKLDLMMLVKYKTLKQPGYIFYLDEAQNGNKE